MKDFNAKETKGGSKPGLGLWTGGHLHPFMRTPGQRKTKGGSGRQGAGPGDLDQRTPSPVPAASEDNGRPWEARGRTWDCGWPDTLARSLEAKHRTLYSKLFRELNDHRLHKFVFGGFGSFSFLQGSRKYKRLPVAFRFLTRSHSLNKGPKQPVCKGPICCFS